MKTLDEALERLANETSTQVSDWEPEPHDDDEKDIEFWHIHTDGTVIAYIRCDDGHYSIQTMSA